MNRRKSLIGAAAAFMSLATVAVGVDVSGAGAATATPAKLPAGYTVVLSSADIAVGAAAQTHGEVSCPKGTLPVGGGAKTPGDSNLPVNMNSSRPKGKRNWAVDMNNSGATASTMRVYAVCIKRPKTKFTVTTATFDAPANAQSVGAVSCSTGAGVVVGGGVVSSSFDTAVNIDTSYPSGATTWTAWMNNASASSATFTVTAICANQPPAGYARVEGTVTPNPAQTQTYSNVTCPGKSVPLSGGIYSDGSGLGQNMNSTGPVGQIWFNIYDNADATANTIHSWAICAGK